MKSVHPEPAEPGTVNVALHVPAAAENPAGVEEPPPHPVHVAEEMLVGGVPVYVPLPAIGEPPTVPLARAVKASKGATDDGEAPPTPAPVNDICACAGPANNSAATRNQRKNISATLRIPDLDIHHPCPAGINAKPIGRRIGKTSPHRIVKAVREWNRAAAGDERPNLRIGR